jgi:nucleoside-diphosphate-sugar epimerase
MAERPKLLILAGAAFVGSALVRAARSRGWDVTCVSRGIRPLPDDVTTLIADRLDEASVRAALAGSDYDYVVDYPRDKRGAELALLRELGEDRTAFYRSGGILGPEENIGRLPWWLGRMARGGDVLAPEDAPAQFVDVRDLAEFVLDSLSAGFSGPVDVVCPSGPVTMGSFLRDAVDSTHDARRESGAPDARLSWLDGDWLLEQGVGPWRELPILGPPQSEFGGLHSSDTSRAVAAGLKSRPVIDTMRDTWASIRAGETPAEPVVPGLGMAPEREAELLASWGARA